MNKTFREVKKTLSHEHVDGVLLTNLINIRYLTGFTGTYASMLITKKKIFFFTDPRYLKFAKKILPKHIELINSATLRAAPVTWKNFLRDLKIKKLGFEAADLSYDRAKKLEKTIKPLKLIPIMNSIEQLRVIKREDELKNLIKAQRIAEKVLDFVKHLLIKKGITEKQIAWEIEKCGHEHGADAISFAPVVAFGNHSAIPHHQNTNRKFKKGEIVLIDMGMKYNGYCSDMTRVFFTAKPTSLEQKIYSLVLEVQEAAIRKIRPKMSGKKVDKIARNMIKKAGYEKNFSHSLGHGIGLEIHEAPNLSVHNEKPLPAGAVVTVEPGIYLEGQFGIRIEDMVILERKGAKNITKFPKTLSSAELL